MRGDLYRVNPALDLTEAYDGSKRRPQRALQPLERDILVRILTDVLAGLPKGQHGEILTAPANEPTWIRLDADEVAILLNVRNVIDPRTA